MNGQSNWVPYEVNASRIPWVPYASVQMIYICLKDKLRVFGMNRLKNNAHNNPPIGINIREWVNWRWNSRNSIGSFSERIKISRSGASAEREN